jgi:hypothetical protein
MRLAFSIVYLTLGLSGVACAASSEKITSENAAYDVAAHAFTTYKLSSLPIECVSFVKDDGVGAGYYFIEAREKHDAHCGGDPDVSPMIQNLRIRKKDGSVSVYDVVDDTYYPIRQFITHRQDESGAQ